MSNLVYVAMYDTHPIMDWYSLSVSSSAGVAVFGSITSLGPKWLSLTYSDDAYAPYSRDLHISVARFKSSLNMSMSTMMSVSIIDLAPSHFKLMNEQV